MTKRKTPAGSFAGRKKSISKSPASKGLKDSLAVSARRRKEARTDAAQHHPDKLADVYSDRQPRQGKDRRSRLTQRKKEQTAREAD